MVTILNTPSGVEVSRDEYGEARPLTIERGRLDRTLPHGAVVFYVGDTAYAADGSATSATDPPDVEPVWRDDPNAAGRSREPKFSIGPVVDLDHELSDRWSARN